MNIVPVSTPFVDVVSELLSRGYRVRFRAEGVSMRPTIRGGETITVEPVSEVKMGDIALYHAERGLIAHRVVAIRNGNGNTSILLTRGEGVGSGEEAVQKQQVLGKVVAVERSGRSVDLGGRWAKLRCRAGRFARLVRHRGARLCGVHGASVFLLASVLAAVFPNVARAVITITGQVETTYTSGNNCSLTGLNTTGANLILLIISGTNANSFSTANVTNPVGATKVLLDSNTGTTTGYAIFEITNFTPSASTAVGGNNDITGSNGHSCGAIAFSDVNLSAVGPVWTSTNGTTNSPQPLITGIDPGVGGVIVDSLSTAGGTAATPAANQSARWNVVTNSPRIGAVSVKQGGITPPIGTMSWTLTATAAWRMAAVPLGAASTTEVQPTSFTVTQAGGRNLITLNTGREVSSLGFNLYREQNGQRAKLNSSLLAGTALLAGSSTSMTAGYVHTWSDSPKGAGGAQYWVEEVDLHGQHTMYGPATPASAPSQASVSVRASAATGRVTDASGQVMMLSQVGQAAPGAGVSSAPHVLQAHAQPTDPSSTTNQNPNSQNPNTQNQNTQTQYRLAAGQAVKLSVQSEGWYAVGWPTLVAAGLDPNAGANSLQLYAEGVQQPILVQGVTGNKLGPQSTIQFYGTGLDTTWSDTRVYWLTWGKGGGQRVQTGGGTPPPGATDGPSSFLSTVEWKPRTVYFAALLNGDADNFFGPTLTSGAPVTQAITLTNLAVGSGEAQLQVTLQGASAGAHSVAVALNGTQLGIVSFSNQTEGVSTLSVASTALVNGQNQLTLTVEGGQEDVSLVDTVELSYPHSYTADNGSLRFTASGGQAMMIGGFGSSQILVADITNPAAVSLVPGAVTQQAGSYAVTIVPQGGGTRTLLALTSASQPVSITAHHPSSWHTAQAGFDMVMLSNADFMQSLNPLVTQHQGEGRKVAVIDVDDLYDEFNFGEKSPYALKNFLSTAKTQWQLPPHFVLLVGDATFDPRNYLGVGDFDFVPTYLVDTALLETASDDWYADFTNQGLPQMAIGRLPVRTAQDAAALVSKIVNYDQSGAANWKKQVLLVADQNDSTDNFQGDSDAVKALLPADLSVSEISQGSGANAQLLSSLNQGQAMVNFIGHGSEQVWTSGLFSTTDAAGLTNGSMVPFVVSMTCLNGYFQDVYGTALAKALIEAPGGGALAVWASSGLTDSGTQATMNQALIKALFGSQSMSLGEAAASAKAAITDLDVRRTWILFGDPATKLQQ